MLLAAGAPLAGDTVRLDVALGLPSAASQSVGNVNGVSGLPAMPALWSGGSRSEESASGENAGLQRDDMM
jgi:hypothetical protein